MYLPLDLLEATNSTRANLISIIILQLIELTGRAQSILAPHYGKNNRPSSNTNMTHSKRIVKAFESFEKCNQGNFVAQHFRTEAPYASMHADICTLALDRRTTIIIIPFHKQWAIDGTLEATFASIRAVNQQVMHKAPCSVGVLIDRGPIREKNRPTLLGSKMVGQPLYQIAMLFIGGYDDREALAYGIRMAEHRNVSFTIVHLRSNNTCEKDTREDEELINDIRANAGGKNKKKIIYREEIVKDGVGTTKVVRTLEDGFDLIVVGRHHAPDSIPTWGLSEWSECTELGLVGDMLATSDFEFSVLVVQQQPEGAELVESPKKTVSRGRYGDKRIYHDYSEDENDHSQSHILSP